MSGALPVLRGWRWLWAVLVTAAVVACAPEPTTRAETPRTRASTPPAEPMAPTGSAATDEATDADPTPPVSATVRPDVVYWATPQPVVQRMLELARVTSDDLVYDLGCGDARSLVTAATRYGARGVGFDIDPALVAEARSNVIAHGVEHLVRIEQADIFTVDLSPASVIFLFLVPRLNLRLVPQLERMRPGSRIVAHEYEIPGARPVMIWRVPGPPNGPPDGDPGTEVVLHRIYLWKVPWQKQATEYTGH